MTLKLRSGSIVFQFEKPQGRKKKRSANQKKQIIHSHTIEYYTLQSQLETGKLPPDRKLIIETRAHLLLNHEKYPVDEKIILS